MTKRIHRLAGAALCGLLVSGCLNLTPPASQTQARGLTVTAISSTRVQVNGARLQMNRGRLEVAGSIAKRAGASTTAFSHVDVRFLDRSGRIVGNKPVSFVPQSVGWSRFGARVAYYALSLDSIPAGAARIEVCAHDADIRTTHTGDSVMGEPAALKNAPP